MIVPCEQNRLDLFINSLRKYQTFTVDSTVEFIVVTRSGIAQKDLPIPCRILRYEYPGMWVNPSMAFNIGVRNSKSSHVIITSPEVLPRTDVLAQFREHFDKDCVVARVTQKGEDLVSSTFRSYHPGFYFLAMYRKSCIEQINGWDEDFMAGVGYDDNDFGERWVRAGLSYTHDDKIIGDHQIHDRIDQAGLQTNSELLNRNRARDPRCINGLSKQVLEDF